MHKSASLAWISSHSLAWYCPGTGSAAQKKRMKAVKEAGEPRAVSESRILLGLVNYCGRFIPYLATVSEPLRRLTKSGTPFVATEFTEYMEQQGIRHHRVTAKWPQAN